ncbi:hypothetical protein GCM10020370_23740 [Paenibacillus hodogayensis]
MRGPHEVCADRLANWKQPSENRKLRRDFFPPFLVQWRLGSAWNEIVEAFAEAGGYRPSGGQIQE